MNKKLKIALIIALVIILIPLIINFYVVFSTKSLIYEAEDLDNNYDYILVLGCGVKNNQPSLMLQDRLDKAFFLYNKNSNSKIFLTGDGNNQEVEVMANYLIDQGIRSDAIIKDEKGYSTGDSLINFNNKYPNKIVIIVTQEYHLPRSLYIAQKLKINAKGVPTQKTKYPGDTYRNLREILARNKDFVKFFNP